MDYSSLLTEFINDIHKLQKARPQKNMMDSLQGEAFILLYLTLQEGDALPGEISAAMGVSTARVSTALNSLGKKGFITRKTDSNDRRRILVSITPQGKASSENQYQKMFNKLREVFEILGEHDSKELVRIIKILADHISTCDHNQTL